jgi:hypothetical protein
MSKKSTASRRVARQELKRTRDNRRWVKKLRALGASDKEIADALDIPESSPLLHTC